ncbi:polysaccharide deacetylase family protein [Clostridium sp. NSJ-6]|uniref:Polysaccharide deacetylase family protein n=1 Tax=Clostridium hominis TaxID=2763036 RepID=A0ABR7D9A3_9CLOT|nr:polysaccharide deacetylase family protein [Clostridium hominis]MBC5627907.1 polysaccharide deacetylase family protein [Clostridium hominis]
MGIFICLVVLILSYSIIPTYYFKSKFKTFNKDKIKDKYMCLTFDDGPDEKYTEQLLNLLERYNIKATFFTVATFAENNPNIIKRMKEEGHTIGLHSLEHKNGLIASPIYTDKDFKGSLDIMKNFNMRVKFFRPPWGHINLRTLSNLKKYNLKLVLWDVIIGDWKGDITSDEIANRLLKESRNKSIICLHDGRGENEAPLRTIQALEKTLPIWLREGYKFVKVEELYE